MPLKANDWPTSGQGVEEIVALRGKSNRWRSRRHRGFPWCTRMGRTCNFHIHNQDYCIYWILHSSEPNIHFLFGLSKSCKRVVGRLNEAPYFVPCQTQRLPLGLSHP